VSLVELAVFEKRVEVLEAEVSKVMGVINAAHGRLVDLLGEALDDELWKVWGIHSPGHWLAWQAGMSTGRAAAIAKVAERRGELPSAVAALRAGEVSVDAAIEEARRAPAGYEESITDFARVATISQLRRCLRRYAYDDETDQAKPKPREDTRSVSMGTDHHGWWLKGRMGVDEGAVVEQAIRAALALGPLAPLGPRLALAPLAPLGPRPVLVLPGSRAALARRAPPAPLRARPPRSHARARRSA